MVCAIEPNAGEPASDQDASENGVIATTVGEYCCYRLLSSGAIVARCVCVGAISNHRDCASFRCALLHLIEQWCFSLSGVAQAIGDSVQVIGRCCYSLLSSVPLWAVVGR